MKTAAGSSNLPYQFTILCRQPPGRADPRFIFETQYRTTKAKATRPSVRTALRAVLGRVSHASVPELLRLPHLKLNLNLRPIPHIPDPISYAPALGTDGSPSRPRTRESRVRTRTPPPLHLKLNLNLNLNLIPHPSSSSHQPSRTWRPWREVFFSPKKKRVEGF